MGLDVSACEQAADCWACTRAALEVQALPADAEAVLLPESADMAVEEWFEGAHGAAALEQLCGKRPREEVQQPGAPPCITAGETPPQSPPQSPPRPGVSDEARDLYATVAKRAAVPQPPPLQSLLQPCKSSAKCKVTPFALLKQTAPGPGLVELQQRQQRSADVASGRSPPPSPPSPPAVVEAALKAAADRSAARMRLPQVQGVARPQRLSSLGRGGGKFMTHT